MKKVSKVEGVPAPRAPYSTYTQAGNLIFVAGQVDGANRSSFQMISEG